jgi:hypothetical protein
MNLEQRLRTYRGELDQAIESEVASRDATEYEADDAASGTVAAEHVGTVRHVRRLRRGPVAAVLAAVSIAAVLAAVAIVIGATGRSSSSAGDKGLLDLRPHVLTISDLPSGWKRMPGGTVIPQNPCIPDLLVHPSGQGRALFLNQHPPAEPATTAGGQGIQEIATSFSSTTDAHRSFSNAARALSNCRNEPIRLFNSGDTVSATAVPTAKLGDEAVKFSLRVTTQFSGQAPTITPGVVTLVRVGAIRLELLVLGADVPGSLIDDVTTRAVAELPSL